MEKLNEQKYLNDDLSHALQNHVSFNDMAFVEKLTGVSKSTMISIRKQKSIVTERSELAVDKLIAIAYRNAAAAERESAKCKRLLKKLVKHELNSQ